mgnify:CR=1 FL=1
MVGVQSIKPIPGNEGGVIPGFWRILSKFDSVYINSSFKYSNCYMFDNVTNRTYKFISLLSIYLINSYLLIYRFKMRAGFALRMRNDYLASGNSTQLLIFYIHFQ